MRVTDPERPLGAAGTAGREDPRDDALRRALVALKDLRARLRDAEERHREPIAIVGMACRFPGGARDPAAFWRLLREGGDAVVEVPGDRWDLAAFYDPDPAAPGKMYSRWGGFLSDPVDEFDAALFGISGREAEQMDPQQRLLLELAWEAFEDAGYAPGRLAGSATGVFVGLVANDWLQQLLDRGSMDAIGPYSTVGNVASVAAGRISYVFGLEGPSFPVDTACSSSLVAIHLAIESLRRGECAAALAGGVNLLLGPGSTIAMCKLRALSPSGRCRAFDAAADGYVRAEGGGLLVLKRLADARLAGDRVLALLRGSAVNHDGRSGGLTVPNGRAQEAVIRRALAAAALAPAAIDYVEAHGTGTQLGDPIEIHALARVFGPGRPPALPLAVGSVKTNLGHLEAAAGCAGLIKVVLAMQESEIPAHLHLRQLNPHIEVGDFPLRIPTAPLPWPAAQRPRLAGVSSFGIGGTNAHVIVEAPPPPPPPAGEPERPMLLTFSGATEPARRAVAGRLARHLAAAPEERLANAAFTANAGRSALAWRGAVVAASAAEAAAKLREAGAAAPASALLPGRRAEAGGPRTAFLFAGEGAEYPGMGGELYRDHPVCRAVLDGCAEILRPLGVPLLAALLPAGDEEGARLLARADCAQPALFAVGMALAELWQGWGIEPAAVLGEGVGEVAAACVAGIFELEPGLRLAAERGRLMQAQRTGGAAAVEPLLDALEAAASRIACSPPRLPFVAGASGEALPARSTLDGSYWRQQVGRPARWADGIAALAAAGCGAFLECGPPVPWARRGAARAAAEGPWLASLGRGPGEGARLLESLGGLYVQGAEVNWAELHAAAPRRRVRLPTYPFERRRFSLAPVPTAATAARSPAVPTAAPTSASRPQPRSGSGGGTLAEELRSLEPASRRERLAAFLARTFAAALRIEEVPAAANLFDLGLDSLLAMEALQQLKPELGFPLYPRELYEHPSIDQLAPYLVDELERTAAPAPAAAPAAALAAVPPPRAPWPSHPAPATATPVPGVVLLLSAPRSGSTLLRVLLAGHPRLFSPPELHLLPFDSLDDRRQALAASHLDEGLDRAIRELRELGADPEALAALESPGLPIPEAYRALRRAAGERLLIDKSPTYAARRETLERAEAWLDGARYIHLVRHPLSVIESFVRLRMDRLAGAAGDDPYRLAERLWLDANRNVARLFAALPPHRRMMVRFEELVREPATVMAGVCRFLGVELDARVLELESGRRMTDGLTSRSLAVGDPGFLARRGIDAALAERWREVVLPAPLAAETEQLARELGYEPPSRVAPAAAAPAPREPLAAAAGETFVDLGGHSLCVCSWGPAAGPAALCLHGILDQAAVWEDLASRLAGERESGWRVVAPDLRGHGRSPHVEPGGAYHLLDFVADADALAGLLGPAPLTLVGHSMGALVAALLAAGRPWRCARLVMIEPPVLRTAPRPWAESLAVLLEDAGGAAAHPVWPDVSTAAARLMAAVPSLGEERALALARRGTEPVAGGGVRWRWDPRLQRRTRLAFGLGAGTVGGGYLELLRQVQAPTTLVFGRDGDLVREPLWEELARELPGVRRCIVDGGHQVHLEAPAALAALLAAGARA